MTPDDKARERALAVVSTATGRTPLELRRFPIGLDHFVFEASFADGPPLVVRVGAPRHDTAAGLRLHRQLRAMGVPLPEIVAEYLDADQPCVVMERFAGDDLGNVIDGLSLASLDTVAKRVAQAQAIVAQCASAGRYGYAAVPENAPYATWSQVVAANLERSRRWMAEAKLFDLSVVDIVAAHLSDMRTALDALPATPFLHDTTSKNVIVTAAGDFSGIVDVDDLCFGDPRYAVALTLVALLSSGGPVAYAELWMHHAGHADDRLFRLYVAVFLVNFMAEHGQVFNGNQRPSTQEARDKLLIVFGEAIKRLNR